MKVIGNIEDKHISKLLDENNEPNWVFLFKNYQFEQDQINKWKDKISDEGWKVLVENQKHLDEKFIRENLSRFLEDKKYLTSTKKIISEELLKNNQLSESFFINNYEFLDKKSWKLISKYQDISIEFIQRNKDYIDFDSLKTNKFLRDDYGMDNLRYKITKNKIDSFVEEQKNRVKKRNENDTYIPEDLKENKVSNIQNVSEDTNVSNDTKKVEKVNNTKPLNKEANLNNSRDLNEVENFIDEATNSYQEMAEIISNKEKENYVDTEEDIQLSIYTTEKSLDEISNFADSCVDEYKKMYEFMIKVQNGEEVNFEEVKQTYNKGLRNITELSKMVKTLKKDNMELQERINRFKHFKNQDPELIQLEKKMEEETNKEQLDESDLINLVEVKDELEEVNSDLDNQIKAELEKAGLSDISEIENNNTERDVEEVNDLLSNISISGLNINNGDYKPNFNQKIETSNGMYLNNNDEKIDSNWFVSKNTNNKENNVVEDNKSLKEFLEVNRTFIDENELKIQLDTKEESLKRELESLKQEEVSLNNVDKNIDTSNKINTPIVYENNEVEIEMVEDEVVSSKMELPNKNEEIIDVEVFDKQTLSISDRLKGLENKHKETQSLLKIGYQKEDKSKDNKSLKSNKQK